MAVLNFCNWNTGDTAEAQSTTGTFSVQTSVVDTGTYALRVNPTTSATGNVRMAQLAAAGTSTTAFNVATMYHRFRFRIATAPASAEEPFYTVLDTGASDKCYLTLTSTRVIKAYDNSGGLIATGTTVLSTGTFYTIELQTSTGVGSQTFVLKINEVTEINTTANQLTNNHGSVRIGKAINLNSQSIDLYFANWIVGDSAFFGVGRSDRLAPAANGSTQQFGAGTGAGNYLEVDEVPTDDDTTYVVSNGSTNQTALFTVGAMGSPSSINAVKVWARARSASGTSSTKIRAKSGATNSDGTAADWTTSYVNRFKLLSTDPATSAAWTESGVNALEAGIVEANAIANRLTTVSVFVDYVAGSPPPPATRTNRMATLGVG